MIADEKLRTLCGNACRVASEDRKREIENLWDEYDIACKLSRGGDAARSAYWEFKARTLENELWQRVKRRAW